jgi:hypothetical protein
MRFAGLGAVFAFIARLPASSPKIEEIPTGAAIADRMPAAPT